MNKNKVGTCISLLCFFIILLNSSAAIQTDMRVKCTSIIVPATVHPWVGVGLLYRGSTKSCPDFRTLLYKDH